MRKKQNKELTPIDKGMLVGVSYSGPLPPPEVLKAYNEAIPDFAIDVWKEVKKDSELFRNAEYKTASRKADMPLFGLIAAFSVCVFAMLVAAYFFYKQYNVAGITFMSALLGTIITSFLKNTSN